MDWQEIFYIIASVVGGLLIVLLGFLIWMLFQLKRTIGRIKRKTEKRVDSFVSLQRILKLKVAEWISKKLS
ncbi:hypothetical protein A2382_04690 [Candidatus Woesebacteria bacterium RIFOXYB1_FULL_38_16]|uniref:Uncharacterized protein n=1 Tax=Candidatus Woesebacteria bacterium RIFOXYB1_FULL_38_16 TaxID=1802538 RepID=A0A1F8CV47_9BACT|nr:MAG: hypothetical protein A2191_02170 [Candidatus Woesebacteria bacterium RIFOXYA1_FULL_38_9]OGM79956.1 MAG: hypothetical protein A2382_04690 [Candidatus Woesebacteria bacterium RIFOXYB1_FULL_38_16]